jgi:uncharacterized protein (UPF0548 family)
MYVGRVLSLFEPSEAAIEDALAARKTMTFSYADVGATRTTPPPGWRINHMRQLVGKGRVQLPALAAALLSWKLLAVDGLRPFPDKDVVEPGTNVAILSRHFGLWSLDFCRVIYVLDDEPEQDGKIRRTGFGYGTLPGHAVRGEEIFSIEHHVESDELWYEIRSFSKPSNLLVELSGPIGWAAQRSFARASVEKAARLARP